MRMLLAAFLALNALFWGLFPHKTHCLLVQKMGMTDCPPHYVHLLMGVFFFFSAVAVAQWSYLSHESTKHD